MTNTQSPLALNELFGGVKGLKVILPFIFYILGSLFFLAGSIVSLVQIVRKG